MSIKTLYLKPRKEESLLRFHPWVFSGAVARMSAQPQEGELVAVCSHQGDILGVGHYQIGSITVRILEFGTDHLSADFWVKRISDAYSVRQALGLISTANNTYRLIHGEGDFLPGLIIDIYDDTAVMQAHSVGMHLNRLEIAKVLMQVVKGLKNVYYKSESTLPFKAPIPAQERCDTYLIGSEGSCISKENGLSFQIDWLRGQKTGFFIDQRVNRQLVGQHSAGRNVLNMFCYTGGFSIYAMQGGANRVDSVDSSEKAIELVKSNMQLNFGEDSRHQEFAVDAFDFLNDNIRDLYDLIVLDPPAFAKHRDSIRHALQGYIRLNAKAFKLIKHDGLMFTFSCSQAIDKDMFRQAVFTAAAQSGRRVRILRQLHQPADHPINIYHPEGEYLKGLMLWVE